MDERIFAYQVFVFFVLSCTTVQALYCHKCNQRGSTVKRCHYRSSIENCNATFPHQPAVCLKIIRSFASGRPPAVFAACDLRSEFAESVLGACHVAPKPKESDTGDRIEMCICTKDLCNRGATISKTVSVLIMITLTYLILMC